MKTQDFYSILIVILEILNLYPDKEINFILKDLKRLKENELEKQMIQKEPKEKTEKIPEKEQLKIIDKFYDNLDSMSISEIEKNLSSENIFTCLSDLKYFAKKCGVEITARQSKAKAIHSIKNYIDRMRIDKTISKRND